MKIDRSYLDLLYTPNDAFGVKMYGAENWNAFKKFVADITDAAILGAKIPRAKAVNDGGISEKLFQPNVLNGCELLGAETFGGIWSSIKSAVSKGSDAMENIPVFAPWVKAGRSFNNVANDIIEKITGGKSWFRTYSDKASSAVNTVKSNPWKTAAIVGGVGVGVWFFFFRKKGKKGKK